MRLIMYEYLEVNLIGVILLLTMFFYVKKRHYTEQEKDQDKRHFLWMLIFNAFILLADNGIYLLRNRVSQPLIILNHVLCISYFTMNLLFCYEWLRYCIAKLYPRYRQSRIEKFFTLLPCVANAFFVASSPLTGWVYSISKTNVYHRGPMIMVSFSAAIIYWIISACITIREWRHPARSREIDEYITLLVFPIPLIVGNVLQMRFYGLSIIWVCSAVSMLILFIDMQNEQLSRDDLTGLYNRRQTNVQLIWEVSHMPCADYMLLVIMMDIDNFKIINDRFGHLSGDRALRTVAKALKENCRKSDFASRFGGDEFLIIGHIKTEQDAKSIIRRIETSLENINKKSLFKYSLSLSAGYAIRSKNDKVTVDSLLNEADGKMYEEKRSKNCLRIDEA